MADTYEITEEIGSGGGGIVFKGRHLRLSTDIVVKKIKDEVSALGSLTNLQELYLTDNNISDISALSGLTNLRQLSLYDNKISDISALSGLTNLLLLGLDGNPITDYSPVSF